MKILFLIPSIWILIYIQIYIIFTDINLKLESCNLHKSMNQYQFNKNEQKKLNNMIYFYLF